MITSIIMESIWDILSILLGLIGVVGVGFGIASYRKQNPKRELVWHTKTTPLISHSTDRLKVTLDDQPLTEPQVTIVTLSSKSRADIPSKTFDDGEPIYFRVSAQGDIQLLLEHSGDIKIKPVYSGTNEGPGFYVPAQLIRKNSHTEFTFVTNGQPKVEVKHSLIDIPVRIAREDDLRPITRKSLIQQILIFVAGIVTVFILLQWAENFIFIFV